MRVLICAPWFRNLARRHARALEKNGFEVLVVTTGAQGDRFGDDAYTNEIELRPQLRSLSTIASMRKAMKTVQQWKPEITFVDETWDPRFYALGRLSPMRVVVVHDANPHDPSHKKKGWKRHVMKQFRDNADGFACFSEFVAQHLWAEEKPVFRLPLLSEVSWSGNPNGTERTIFSFVGRISEYKGLDFLLEAWDRFSRIHPGQQLHILGTGKDLGVLPNDVKWTNRRYEDTEAIDILSRSRAVILPYREASQSGVQVLAMQCGAPTIVTDVGALPELQPPNLPVVRYADVDALVASMEEVLSDEVTATYSALAHEQFLTRHTDAALEVALVRAISSFSPNRDLSKSVSHSEKESGQL